MKQYLSLQYSFDLIFAAVSAASVLGVLQTFLIGRHYIIPTGILAAAILTGNIARYGFQDRPWAKQTLFWSGFLFTAHAFMAIFFSKRYPEVLGAAFLPVLIALVVLSGFLTYQYARKNHLFGS